MSSSPSGEYLYGQLRRNFSALATDKPYLTFTLRNGTEIYTVEQRHIKVTRLNKASQSTRKLDLLLEFDPESLCVNRNEQLMCLYDRKHCHVISLNGPNSSICFTTVYKLKLDLKSEESVVQAVFNNVSKYQSELVLLTSTKLVCYDINESLDKPVQALPFSESGFGSGSGSVDDFNNSFVYNSFSSQEMLLDPVSVCFASDDISNNEASVSPISDLTLCILTSDFSIYRIFPFFPRHLSVSKIWLSSLFDTTSVLFSSLKSIESQTKFMGTMKLAARLSKTSGDIYVKDLLPKSLSCGKLLGPLPISPFFDDLYSMNALRLISLPYGVICVVADRAVVALVYEHTGTAIFADERIECEDKFTLVDSVQFDGNHTICSGFAIPPNGYSLGLVTSEPKLVLVDYSTWMKPLRKAIESGDIKLFASKFASMEMLPTEVKSLGNIGIPGLFTEKRQRRNNVLTCSLNNRIWLAWNEISTFALALSDQSGINMSIIPLVDESDDESCIKSLSRGFATFADTTEKEYYPKISGSFMSEVEPQLTITRQKIIELKRRLSQEESSRLLDMESVEDLSVLERVGQTVSMGVISIFGDIATISRRLIQEKSELKNQISTLDEVRRKEKKMIPRFETQMDRIEKAEAKQQKLRQRIDRLYEQCQNIVAEKSQIKEQDLSREEVAYVEFLNSIRQFVTERQEEYKKTANFVRMVKESDSKPIIEKRLQLERDESVKNLIRTLEKKLQSRDKLVDMLSDELSKVKV
ncbi:hypothetical protein FOA43_002473 [Brettanomyces nanus]|uniref:Uncharacterized protein n=1 Tax=Eeniella nana TaxID=13502 RepID=A0A875RPJ4_EENNA|nr:uncharacterized protein FOA43_002473 [Brettanomyces nanus]QPG75130.1 hypothetical protein FOA43_002473 [Brettanomyces nanus]